MKEVDEYLNALPADMKKILVPVRNAIKESAPGAEEVFGYGMPGYKYKGPLLYIAAFKNHCSIFGMSRKMLSLLKNDLSGYTINGSTLQFTPAKPLPASLVKKIVAARIGENESKSALKSNPKTRKTSKSAK